MTNSLGIVVLAGDRAPGTDALARAAGTASKVLVPVSGVPVVDRVVSAVEAAAPWRAQLLAGPPHSVLEGHDFLATRVADRRWQWMATAASPAATVVAALTGASRPPAIITTADHAFLRADILTHFAAAAEAGGGDVAIGFARLAEVQALFPDTRRTGWRFRDDIYCGCNLFAFRTAAALRVAELWQRFEADRKRPWRIMHALGLGLLARYLTRRITLEQALAELGRRASGVSVVPVVLPYPEAAVDVDSVADWQLVNANWQRIVSRVG